MALDRQQNHPTGQRRLQTGLFAILMTSALVPVSSAQTVVIGGGNSAPVTVNMSGVNNGQPYVLQRRQSPVTTNTNVAATQPTVDYSKEAEIRYGNEVIKLVPPGSQPKKRITPAVSRPKAAPKATPKLADEKVIAPAPKPAAPVKKAAAPKPKPVEKPVVTEKPTTEKAQVTPKSVEAPKAVIAQPTAVEAEKPKALEPKPPVKPEMAKKPDPKPADITPKAPVVADSPQIEAPVKSEQEMQVAAVAPTEKSAPAAAKPKIQPIEKTDSENASQILFEEGETKLPFSATDQLGKLAKAIEGNNDRIQLVAYANASSNGTARRISLGRALVIRSKLMELGVPNNKIEVRALGRPDDASPADRVDLKLVAR